MRVLVIVPTYNEVENLAAVTERLLASVPGVSLLVVDDASPDGTAELAAELERAHERVHLMRRAGKAGLGSAYRAGFGWGFDHEFDVMVEMDADLSHDPAALPALLHAIEDGADLVIGSRYVSGGDIPDWSWHRRALSRWGNRYAATMLQLAVRDATAGYRAYRASLLSRMDLDAVRADGYGFQVEMTERATDVGARIVEVPIVFRDRRLGDSKMSWPIVVEALVLVTRRGISRRIRRVIGR